MGMGGNENSNFPISSQKRKRSSPSVVLHQLLRELRRIGTHSTVIAHQLRSAMSLTLRISAINSMAAMNWRICQPTWEWEREEMGIANGNRKGMGIKLG